MTRAIARGLRRIVDALQRSLFDDDALAGPAVDPPVAAPPRGEPLREIVLDGRRVGYALVRCRRRTIGFVVGAEGLVVRAPSRVPLREIEAGLREKAGWIVARLAEQRLRTERRESQRIVWQDGAVLELLGEPVRLALVGGGGATPVELDPPLDADADADAAASGSGAAVPSAAPAVSATRTLRVALPRDADAARVRNHVEAWLRRQALLVFERRCRHFEALLGVRVIRLSLSSAATRWGSANASGAVRLHWRLIHFAPATIDYVVAHELAHLREMNHGPRFWRLVRAVVPDADAARARLGSDARRAWD